MTSTYIYTRKDDHIPLTNGPLFNKSNRIAMNRNWSNQRPNPILKTKMGINKVKHPRNPDTKTGNIESCFNHRLGMVSYELLGTLTYLIRIVRKPTFCIYANKKTQISFEVTAKLISAFVFATQIVQSLYFINQNFQAFLWLYSLICVEPGRKPERLFSHDAALQAF